MSALDRRPPGVKLLQSLCKNEISFKSYQLSVLVLTFVAYTLYHLVRKPASIVKSTLVSSVGLRRPPGDARRSAAVAGWAPFDGDSGAVLLGEIDVAFLAVYAVGTFFAGHLGDRVCLRWFLSIGMAFSGLFAVLFGMAYWWGIHSLAYFFVIQMAFGVFQATGWPSVVAVVARWCGKKKRGLIMGVWSAHTSLGNICGSLIASSLLEAGWGWAFVVPGIAIGAGGLLIFTFLVVDPEVVGLPSPSHDSPPFDEEQADEKRRVNEGKRDRKVHCAANGCGDAAAAPLLVGYCAEEEEQEVPAVTLLQALAIPGVIPFALCLFFAKLVAYTFIYWLPFYISSTGYICQDLGWNAVFAMLTLSAFTSGFLLTKQVSIELKGRRR